MATEKKRTLDEVADTAAQAQPQVTRILRGNAIPEDIEFPDTDESLEDIHTALEERLTLISFKHPTDNEKELNFLVRHLTPAEWAMIYGNLFGKDLAEILQETQALTEEERTAHIENYIKQQIDDEQTYQAEEFERRLKVCKIAIVEPKRLQLERMRKWNPFYVNALFNAITGDLTANNAVTRFLELGTPAKK